MNKVVKRILKIVGIAIAVIVVVLIGYIIYLYASYHRIEDNKKLKVEGSFIKKLPPKKPIIKPKQEDKSKDVIDKKEKM